MYTFSIGLRMFSQPEATRGERLPDAEADRRVDGKVRVWFGTGQKNSLKMIFIIVLEVVIFSIKTKTKFGPS
jgi:hypothetical protein